MESEKYICVRETGASNQLLIVDMANPSQPVRRPITADSAVMNPDKNVIALKAGAQPTGGGNSLQVFDLETKTKLKAFAMNENVVFWRWISSKKLGMVTMTGVYHWDIEGSGDPIKVFDRAQNLSSAQIISYKVDPTEKWCVLIGIGQGSADRPNLVKGYMQLYSVDQGRSQALEAHAADFSTIKFPEKEAPSTVISFAQKTVKDGQLISKLHIIELGGAGTAIKKQAELFFPQEFADDFPVSMQFSEKYGLIYVITKLGILFVYDLETATAVYRNRISPDPIFLTTNSPLTGGLYAVNRRGQVLHANVNEPAIVPFVSQQLNNLNLALALAKRGNLPGAEDLVGKQFAQLFASQKYKEAAECAAESPQSLLRNAETMEKLKAVPAQPGQKSPILVYFGILLSRGKLNKIESAELAKIVIAQNKKELLTNWWNEGKLEASEELGDLVKNAGDNELSLKIFEGSGSSSKVVAALAEKGDLQELMKYAGATGQTPDFMYLLQSMMMNNPQGAVSLAKMISNQPNPPIEINTITDLFLQRNMIREATAYLLDVLKEDKPEHAALQTKVLEINLVTNPNVADAILGNGSLSQYDKPRIAQLCEKAGLYMRALQHYTELPDIKRVIVNTHAIDPTALTQFFGTLSADWALDCLKEMLTMNPQQNLQIVVNIAKEYTGQLTSGAIIAMLESFNSYHGLFYYLGSQIAFSEDPDVHYKYIEAAAKIGQLKEVERMTRESSVYPPEKVKSFLIEAKLPDSRPLINVCDRFDMVEDLTHYLFSNNMLKYIEGYVQKVNPSKGPQVVGALVDAEAPDEFITNLIISVRALVPIEKLVAEIETRNRLKILSPVLELLISEGSTDVQVHSALGKIIVDTNNNPEHFLTTNPYYDSLIVGKYCEKRDPNLAFIAYKRGLCDDALVECTTKNSLFKLQARYIVERQDHDLWMKVLDPEREYRKQLIDQVVSTALPESTNPEQVSTTVRAFMAADLQGALIELLEKIVLQNSAFSNNSNLQNLLIITAIKADKTRVKDYIHRLDNFDGTAVAEIAIGYELYDEAFEIYQKFDLKVEAVKVLLEHLADLNRALDFATKVDEPHVWSELGHSQLEHGLVSDAIVSYLRAEDPSKYTQVIEQTKDAGCFEDLVKYLIMARKSVKDAVVDTELVYAYAKIDQLSPLEAFIAGSHQANLQSCGDRCFNEALYEAAKILYKKIPNWGRLASTYVKLHRFQDAVDAARKANSPKTWKEVCYACAEESEFRLAQLCGMNIIINADDLEEVSEFYQSHGFFDELISLMESGIGLERAHMGIFTELGVLYAKYRPEKLMEHLKLFSTRLNIPKLIRVSEDQQHWKELAFLYVQYDEHDNAAIVMMNHSPDSWDHVGFKDVAVKVSNVEVFYRAISFYLQEQPSLLTDLLKVLEARIDHIRVVGLLRRGIALALCKEYLLSVQKSNLKDVNEAVNDLLIEEEDYVNLKSSIETYDTFDKLALANRLETHELLEFRRIAAYLYKKNLKWRKAVELAKQDKLYKDAMETAAQSTDPELAEQLLRFFVQEQEYSCFAAMLYTCYDLIKPDVAMEVAWMNGLTQLAMPFMIQTMREQSSKIDMLITERDEAKEASKAAAASQTEQEAARNAYQTLMPLALPPAPMPQQPPPGMPMPGQFDPNAAAAAAGMMPSQVYGSTNPF
eukprot:g1201.t1